MSKKTPPSVLTLKTIRDLNHEMGLPTSGIDALINAEEAGDDELFALCLAALSEIEKQGDNLAITRH